MRTRGGDGYGVLVRTRLTIFLPSASSTDALRPVPPMSIASVVGLVGRFDPDPPCASFTSSSCRFLGVSARVPIARSGAATGGQTWQHADSLTAGD